MFMFGITTFMFALALIELVLGATVVLQTTHNALSVRVPLLTEVYNVWAIIAGLMVRFQIL